MTLRKAGIGILSLLGLLVLGVVLFFLFFDVKAFVERKASGQSGREIKAEKLDLDWGWTTKATIDRARIANIAGAKEPAMAEAEKIVVSIHLPSLLKGKTVIPELVLEKPRLILEKDAEGNANWNFTDNPAGAAVTKGVAPESRGEMPAIGRLVIRDGLLKYKDTQDGVDLDVKMASVEASAKEKERIRLEGSGSYKQRPFKLDLTGGSVLTLRDTSEPYPLAADITIGGTSGHLEGTLDDPFQLKGMDLQLRIKGPDAAELFPIFGIALPPTPPYNVSGHLTFAQDVWKFLDFSGRMGDSDLAGDLTWDTSKKRPLLTANFVSKKLDFDDLGPLVGAPPSTKPGETASAEQKQEAAAKAETPRALPDAPLDISRLAAMDARVEFTGRQVISPSLPLDDFYMKVNLDDRLLKLEPVKFGTADGKVEAILSVNARKEPVVITSDITFRRLSLARLFRPLAKKLDSPNVAQGYIGGTAKLTGTGKSLHAMLASSNGTVGVGMEGGQLSNLVMEAIGLDVQEGLGFLFGGDKPTQIRCVIGDFGVANGIMKSNALVADTVDTNVQGEGTLNLGTEELDLTLTPHPKDASLLSLRSPIHIRGVLKKPKIVIDKASLLERGGIGAVLAAAFPPAAALAFIEPGLGKDSDCGRLLAEMRGNNAKAGGTSQVPKNK